MFKFQIIKNSSIIDEFNISKNFNFEKYNLHYSWDEENFIIKYAKKEIQKNIYLACTKRGNNGQNCHGKAKFEKNTGKIIIYEKWDNSNNNHYIIEYDIFKKYFYEY